MPFDRLRVSGVEPSGVGPIIGIAILGVNLVRAGGRRYNCPRIMSHTYLVCQPCGSVDAPPGALWCQECGGPLDVAYRSPPRGLEPRGGLPGVWRWWDRMPLHEEGSLVSLGEGGTPCLHLKRTGARLGLDRLYAKVEYANPTGSFKDRGTAVMLSMVREMGFSEAVDDSSGNAGASLAAYASRGGIRAAVFVPAGASPFKMSQIGFYGAALRPVEGPREGVTVAAREYVAQAGAFYASHNWSPYFIQGMKSFAYEAVQDVPDAIDHVVVPVGNGSMVVGPARGFAELTAEGTVPRMPRFHAVQSRSCMPVVAAWQGQPWTLDRLRPTVAGGIAVSTPPRGGQTVDTLRSTGGTAVAVEEEAIVRWQRRMAQDEGLFMEPTSAAAFSGLESLVAQGAVRPGEVVLVPVTGFGLKDRLPGN